jgi:phosphate starvation-inducible PhoH-like protein
MSIAVSKRINISESNALKLFGERDKYLRIISRSMGADVAFIGGELTVTASDTDIDKIVSIFEYLSKLSQGRELTADDIYTAITLAHNNETHLVSELSDARVKVSGSLKFISPKSLMQMEYLNAIRSKDIVFSYGPAGTGKTFLAVAMAVSFYLEKKVQRIILTRPAVEAGERLGFLPGDLAEKINPYLRPLHDALQAMLEPDLIAKLVERGVIEVAPLAFMRGRTLTNAFVILDEAQNTTISQMKMFLTRLGFGSKIVVTGDTTQTDLPSTVNSGLTHALDMLSELSEIGFIHLSEKDTVRHPLVTKIIQAY